MKQVKISNATYISPTCEEHLCAKHHHPKYIEKQIQRKYILKECPKP
jgi:hypothetical protein